MLSSLPHVPLHVMIQALANAVIYGGSYALFRALTADHLRQGYGLNSFHIIPVCALTLERDVACAIRFGVARMHKHDRRMVTILGSGTGEVLRQLRPLFLGQFFDLAQGSSFALNNRRFQRVCAPVRLWCLGTHAEMGGGQNTASIDDLYLLDAFASRLYRADLLAGDLAFFHAVDLGHFCGYPSGHPLFCIRGYGLYNLAGGFLHAIDLLPQGFVILDLAGYRHDYSPLVF